MPVGGPDWNALISLWFYFTQVQHSTEYRFICFQHAEGTPKILQGKLMNPVTCFCWSTSLGIVLTALNAGGTVVYYRN